MSGKETFPSDHPRKVLALPANSVIHPIASNPLPPFINPNYDEKQGNQIFSTSSVFSLTLNPNQNTTVISHPVALSPSPIPFGDTETTVPGRTLHNIPQFYSNSPTQTVLHLPSTLSPIPPPIQQTQFLPSLSPSTQTFEFSSTFPPPSTSPPFSSYMGEPPPSSSPSGVPKLSPSMSLYSGSSQSAYLNHYLVSTQSSLSGQDRFGVTLSPLSPSLEITSPGVHMSDSGSFPDHHDGRGYHSRSYYPTITRGHRSSTRSSRGRRGHGIGKGMWIVHGDHGGSDGESASRSESQSQTPAQLNLNIDENMLDSSSSSSTSLPSPQNSPMNSKAKANGRDRGRGGHGTHKEHHSGTGNGTGSKHSGTHHGTGGSSDTNLPIIPVKRKRGRPRKYPLPDQLVQNEGIIIQIKKESSIHPATITNMSSYGTSSFIPSVQVNPSISKLIHGDAPTPQALTSSSPHIQVTERRRGRRAKPKPTESSKAFSSEELMNFILDQAPNLVSTDDETKKPSQWGIKLTRTNAQSPAFVRVPGLCNDADLPVGLKGWVVATDMLLEFEVNMAEQKPINAKEPEMETVEEKEEMMKDEPEGSPPSTQPKLGVVNVREVRLGEKHTIPIPNPTQSHLTIINDILTEERVIRLVDEAGGDAKGVEVKEEEGDGWESLFEGEDDHDDAGKPKRRSQTKAHDAHKQSPPHEDHGEPEIESGAADVPFEDGNGNILRKRSTRKGRGRTSWYEEFNMDTSGKLPTEARAKVKRKEEDGKEAAKEAEKKEAPEEKGDKQAVPKAQTIPILHSVQTTPTHPHNTPLQLTHQPHLTIPATHQNFTRVSLSQATLQHSSTSAFKPSSFIAPPSALPIHLPPPSASLSLKQKVRDRPPRLVTSHTANPSPFVPQHRLQVPAPTNPSPFHAQFVGNQPPFIRPNQPQ
ncbi:hypothetical protein BLNAU_2559 [Blattamonas nauphoetae]|uniref:Uncharacterized protein n=1 Tax=Blattamonas nauphoetae TaxID=2049346 RepID=A0ABQ9YFB3_9EUKA|nr:hypothetical protein BLNAU_2559 [Blattamonas nauphoetae]